MAKRLDGKVAVVTGASRGIGKAIAEAMAAEGAKVVVASRKPEGVEASRDAIVKSGHEAEAIACHVGKEEDRKHLLEATEERFGPVDILVNNAGTNPYFGPMLGLTEAALDKTFEVNLKGPIALSRAVAQSLVDRKAGGAIINVSSVLGTMAAPMQGAYAMTKAALISFTKTFALELSGTGIRVNAIAPGLVETRFAQALVSNDAIREQVLARTAAKRVGAPEDIAGGAVYLASEEASYVTGHTLVIDGGWTAG